MDLQNLRYRLAAAIDASGASQHVFALKHGFSSSTLNKFLNGKLSNPRLSTIHEYEHAIERAATLHNPYAISNGIARRRVG